MPNTLKILEWTLLYELDAELGDQYLLQPCQDTLEAITDHLVERYAADLPVDVLVNDLAKEAWKNWAEWNYCLSGRYGLQDCGDAERSGKADALKRAISNL